MIHTTPMQDLVNHKPQNDKQYLQEPPLLKANNLRELQTNYLLDKLQEESAEVIQAVSKIRRFGINNKHPDRTTTNLQELVNELEDVLAIVGVLESCGYFDLTTSKDNISKKAKQLLR